MASTAIESVLLHAIYRDEQMQEVFSDKNLVQQLLNAEAAMSRAQARVGLIPQEAAEEIARKARVENFPLEELGKQIAAVDHFLVPLTRALEKACEGAAGGYVHWGATTQDIYDTANMLQYREAIGLLLSRLYGLRQALAELAEREADTLIAGRTHGQHGLPTTFGYKVSIWCWEIARHIERWEQAKPRVLVGNFTGAVGTFAGFGGKGLEMQRLALEDLGLGVPESCWHSSRDRYAEMASLLILTAGTIQKIGREIYRLQSTEYQEVEEPFYMGKVSSSTMPHKRNPTLSEGMVTMAVAVRAEASMLFEAMPQEHEREMGLWNSEWVGLPNAFMLLGVSLLKAQRAISGLRVNREQMEKNLGITHGLILSEVVMLELGRFVGREHAHEIVYRASMRAFEERRSLKACLTEMEEVTGHLSGEDLDRLLDYRSYLGSAPELARAPGAAFLGKPQQ